VPEGETPALERPPPLDHNHKWQLWRMPGKTTWRKGHALAYCMRKGCGALTVVGYQEGYGPCSHAISRALAQETPMVLEWSQCTECSTLFDPERDEDDAGDTLCPGCRERSNEPA